MKGAPPQSDLRTARRSCLISVSISPPLLQKLPYQANSLARIWSHLCVYSGLFGPGKREPKELKRESYSGKIIGQRGVSYQRAATLNSKLLVCPGCEAPVPTPSSLPPAASTIPPSLSSSSSTSSYRLVQCSAVHGSLHLFWNPTKEPTRQAHCVGQGKEKKKISN